MLKEYFSIAEILELKLESYLDRRNLEIKVTKENWLFRTYKTTKKDGKEYHISNFPAKTREKIVAKLLEKSKKEALLNGKNTDFVIESLNIAYSRLEIMLFLRATKMNVYAFCKTYNNREFVNNEISENTYFYIPNTSKSRVYNWIKQYDLQGLEGLKWRVDERKLGKSIYVEAVDMGIKDLIVGILLEKPHLKIKVIYKFLCELAKKKHFNVPSYRTVCNYVNEYKDKNKQEYLFAKNPDAWKSKYLLAIGSYSDGIVEPNQLWELDSSPADIMLEGGRYMILACIDVYSRRVKFLVNKTSNSLGITSLLRACFLEWGIPKSIKTDNGKDYVSQQIKIVLNEFGIEHKLANPFQGQEKPHVERVFKRFQHDFVESLPNFIGHNVLERKALQSIKSFEDRLFGKQEILYMTSNRFQEFCNYWIAEHYMKVPHLGINNQTPQSRLDGFIPKLPQGEQIHKLSLLLEPLAGLRTIVKKGIRVENTFYFNPELAIYVGEQVQVRVDRLDMGKIYVFDKNHTPICEAVNYELLGNDKQEFIKQGKQIQNQVLKLTKEKTKRLINKAKGKLDYLEPIQIDLEEAIAEVKKSEVLNGTIYEETIQEEQQNIDEKELRYQKFKILEMRLAKGEQIDEEDLRRLMNYQNTGEYISKKDRDINLEEFKNKQSSEFDSSLEDASNSITSR